MNLQTKVEIKSNTIRLSYSDKILFLGSCFANEIGAIMKDLKFSVLVNPFGVLYNPASVSGSLDRLRTKRPFLENDIIKDDDIFKSLYHSSEFASMSMKELMTNINVSLDEAASHFNESKWIVVSLGTRWIYRLRSNGAVVANCHKLNQDKFVRESLNTEDIVELLSPCIEEKPE